MAKSFNPRTPSGGATLTFMPALSTNTSFQSTHPAGATAEGM